MRLFVALPVPAEVRENLRSLLDQLHAVDSHQRFIPPENLHLTLKFIGEVPPDRLAAIAAQLEKVRLSVFVELQFRGIGFFPNARRPSVAWVGILSSPQLAQLAAAINDVLSAVGIPRDEKPFVPHLTIARFKLTRISTALSTALEKFVNQSFGSLSSGEFQLIESQLKSGGAEYTTLRSFRFAPEPTESQHS